VKKVLSFILACLFSFTTLPSGIYAQTVSNTVIYSQQELDQLLAPIALYPDALLSQILMAATYPLEVVQASRFVKQNPNLKGDALAQASQTQTWDPSVKALLPFPSVLSMMDEQLPWTQKLGDAFLSQQETMMDTVQALREKAKNAGHLVSNQQQQVIVQDSTINIEPYAPDTIYVPYYNPMLVYGAWWWPNYPPMFWNPPAFYGPYYGDVVAGSIAFGIGFFVVDSLFIRCQPDWHHHQFMVYGSGRPGVVWAHNPEHRLGVAYRDTQTRNRFQTPLNTTINRDTYRGHLNQTPQLSHTPSTFSNSGESLHQNRIPEMQQTTIEQAHPFIPSAPARSIETNSDRGRMSREQSTFAPRSSPSPSATHRQR